MRIASIHIDRLDHSLRGHGIALRRAQLMETASYALGYHNSNEYNAAARRGDLTPPRAEPVARIEFRESLLVVLRDPQANCLYAVEESFLDQVVGEERRESFGNSPYGHLLDLRSVCDDPVTGSAPEELSGGIHATPMRFVVVDATCGVRSRHDDEAAARDAAEDIDDAMVVDVAAGGVLHHDRGWRRIQVEGRDERETILAAALAVATARLERSREKHEQTLRIDVPDWRAWTGDLKKASRKNQEPISDELLHQFRHAVADVHCKSSASERSEVEWRQRLYVEKHLGGLITRLDRAEDALREAGLTPSGTGRRSRHDAEERLAAIEAVAPRREPRVIPGLYEVDATRNGDRFREIFRVEEGVDHMERAYELAAGEFRIDVEAHRDSDGSLDEIAAECDSFYVEPVHEPVAAVLITDALSTLAFGASQGDHPARIKMLAAREAVMPKPTI
jgi:hypothetical protein